MIKKLYYPILVIILVIVFDQYTKIYVKTHFEYAESISILGLSWAKIHFVENEGMAFGITLGDKCIGITDQNGSCKGLFISAFIGKLFLSLFRITMVVFLFNLLYKLILDNTHKGIIICLSLVIAGAIGNIIDSTFYGVIFSQTPYHSGIAEIFPSSGGYGSFLHGRVVDMLYFPLIDTTLPEWFPLFGGQRFQFFNPVFNVADSSIFIGVVIFILFFRNKINW